MSSQNQIAQTPEAPYFAVIFTSRLAPDETKNASQRSEYEKTANRMIELASEQDGFLGIESARDETGTGITVSYWRDRESIRAWYENAEHKVAQEKGRLTWYQRFAVRVCEVDRQYDFEKEL